MHMAVYMRGRWSVGLFVVYSSALDVSSLPFFFFCCQTFLRVRMAIVVHLTIFVSTLCVMVLDSCHSQGCQGCLMHWAQTALGSTKLLGNIPQDDIFSKMWEL